MREKEKKMYHGKKNYNEGKEEERGGVKNRKRDKKKR